MARSKGESKELAQLKKDIDGGSLKNIYVFYGEERYLLEYYLSRARKSALEGGAEDFNYKKISGREMTAAQLFEAVDTLPVFSSRTFIEIDDYDIFKANEETKKVLLEIFSDIPEYVCLVFVYDTVEYKSDGRVKINGELKKYITAVEFAGQSQSDLISWITRRFRALGRQIDRQTADYMIFMAGTLMTKLVTEIEKVASYSKAEWIRREDIDAVVVPEVDAVTYKMTNAIIEGDFSRAIKILSDLNALNEPPHKIIYSISMRLRQLYSACVCLEYGKGAPELMDMFDIKNDYQVRGIITGAKRAGSLWCREAMGKCAGAALKLNSSSSDNGEILSQLLVEMDISR